jgi:hypothetical protein
MSCQARQTGGSEPVATVAWVATDALSAVVRVVQPLSAIKLVKSTALGIKSSLDAFIFTSSRFDNDAVPSGVLAPPLVNQTKRLGEGTEERGYSRDDTAQHAGSTRR